MTFCQRSLLTLALSGAVLVYSSLPPVALAQDSSSWTDKDTRLATEYLGLLVEKPDDERVLELLWSLYHKHQQSDFLLESIAAQAAQNPHPHVLLVHAQLLRKAGKNDEALSAFQEVLKLQPEQPAALQASQELLLEKGDPEAALENLRKLTATVPVTQVRHARLLLKQAELLLSIDRPENAAVLCEQALAQHPTDTGLLQDASRLLLGAGMLDKTVQLMEQLVASTSDPTQRLDALFDLSRLHEQNGDFQHAAATLQKGLGILHDKDWRYSQFFQRLVKVHERFDHLDDLKKSLLDEAEKTPVTEKALNNLARFSSLVVDGEERIRWLQELVKQFPENLSHRWELVTVLIDYDRADEAARLLDPYLKRDGNDRPQLIILRATAYLNQGKTGDAVKLLTQLLDKQAADPEIEKQVLAFARQKSLDALVSLILKRRIDAQPGKAEPVFELATFYRTRGNHKNVEKLFSDYTEAGNDTDKQRRLNEVASFLATSPDLKTAEQAARDALASPSAGRDEMLRLADVLIQRSAMNEAQTLLEGAWKLSVTEEQRADVDERLASVLTGDPAAKLLATPMEPSPEFKLPSMFTGEGFGSDTPVEADPSVPEALAAYAQNRALGVLFAQQNSAMQAIRQRSPWFVRQWMSGVKMPAQWGEDILLIQRAAWWCLRTGQPGLARAVLHDTLHDQQGKRLAASVEMEKLWLEVLLQEGIQPPVETIEQLKRVAELDPASRTACMLRLAEVEAGRDGATGLPAAIQILEDLQRAEPQNEAVLSALSQFYLESNQREKALALWENAARDTNGRSGLLLERYGELLIAQRRFEEYLHTQMRLLEQETDIKRRRDFFQRAMQRLLWTDASQGELSDDEVAKRLDIFENMLAEQARRDPFEGFWNEALAHIYEREGDDEKAFASMKQAYYTAPDTPFSLEQLRASALRVGDIKSAIYFQKQIAASSSMTDQAAEWRQLVQLLESDFRMDEADRARRRVEARFSQDPAALDQLAKYYTDTAQDEAAARVLEQLVRVRGWDAKNLLRLALQQKVLGQTKSAINTLQRLLTDLPLPAGDAASAAQPVERWPWPVFDERDTAASSPMILLGSLDNVTSLDAGDRDRLRQFLSLPRPELTTLPDGTAAVRLRALQELVKLEPAITLPDNLSEIERLWVNFHGDIQDALKSQLIKLLLPRNTLEARFLFTWMGLKSHNTPMLADWALKASGSEKELRRKLVHTCLQVLSDDLYFHLTKEDARLLGGSGILSHQEVFELAQKLESRQDPTIALELVEATRKTGESPSLLQLIVRAQIAENSGDEKLQRRCWREVWEQPILPAQVQLIEFAFVRSFKRLWQLSRSPAEKEALLHETLHRLSQLPPTTDNALRSARIFGIIGATEVSEKWLEKITAQDLVAARPLIEPIMGKLPPGVTPGPRIDNLTHMQDYWRDVKALGEMLKDDNLSTILPAVDKAVDKRNAGVALGPRSNYEYNAWRHNLLVRQLRFASFPERQQMVREMLEADDSVDAMLDLGNFLDSQGFPREAIAVFKRLVPRAPANDEYSLQLRRACENAREAGEAIEYLEKTLPADVHQKPQGIDETFREEHARHLARLQDPEKLRRFAFLATPTVRLQPGRVPEQVPYLKELALMLEARNDEPAALAAWEEMHRLWPRDIEASLHRARLLNAQGNVNRALEALREIPLVNFWNDPVREAFSLRAELAAQAGLWDEIRELMNLVTGNASGRSSSSLLQSTPVVDPFSPTTFTSTSSSIGGNPATYTGGVLILSKVLIKHQRHTEALSLLQRAERSVRDNTERFKLRLQQIKLAALKSNWSPSQDYQRISAWLRSFTDDREGLHEMLTFLEDESLKPRAREWLMVLQQKTTPQHSMTALAITAFADKLTEEQARKLPQAWDETDAYRENARELTVRSLLEKDKVQWANWVALSGPKGGIRQSPLYVEVLHAMQDRIGMQELFHQVAHGTFPGSGNVNPYAEAFAQTGRFDLAEELYALALNRLRDTATTFPPLIEGYSRFLIQQHRHEQAETLLLHEHQGMTEGLAPLLVELYRSWNKLDQLEQELAKYHLPDGIFCEARFLASQPAPAAP